MTCIMGEFGPQCNHKNTASIIDDHTTANLVLQSTDPEIDAILQPVRDARLCIPQKKTLRTLETIEAMIVARQSDLLSIDEL